MTASVAVTIPGGVWPHGSCRRDAELRRLTGEEQVFLTEDAATLPLAQWSTEVLARCLTRLGPLAPVTRDDVRSLTAGDREALLLHLRRLTAGDRLPCLLTCPAPECGHALELELSVADLLVGPRAETAERYTFVRPDTDNVVGFRLPTGADQEAAALVARTDPAGAAALLLRRCLDAVDTDDGLAALLEPLSARMAELDAQAELALAVLCPACSGTFTTVFDTAGYLFQELRADTRRLDCELHLLAYHYHWSPTEILAMSPRRRRRYLELLEEEVGAGVAG